MDILGAFGIPIAVISIAVAILGTIVFVARNYLKCPPNEVLVLYGRKHKAADTEGKPIVRGYRMITGGAAFRVPLLERAQFLSLALFPVPVRVDHTPNKDGVPVTVDSVANVRISGQPTILFAAVERFLGKGMDEIKEIIHNTLEGLVRQLVGTLTVEEMLRDREAIAHKILDLTQSEFGKIGMVCENFVITKVEDAEGYIQALGKKKTAEVKRDAAIGEAEAQREATIKASTAKREAEAKRLENEAQIADAQRDLDVRKAKYTSEVQAEQARAALAGEIAKKEREKELTLRQAAIKETEAEAMAAVAEKEAVRREKELVASVLKPAEADRQAMIIKAEAERQAAIVTAEGQANAQVQMANAEATAMKAKAQAEQVRLEAEGMGHAAAEAALKRQQGLAEAEVVKARGEAEGSAVLAKALAEAEGLAKKNEALSKMGEGARLILVLERLPGLIDETGEAVAKALTPVFQAMGAGLAAVDNIQIVDLGGASSNGKGGAVERFALSLPETVLKLMQQGRALGFDLEGMLKKVGFAVKESRMPKGEALAEEVGARS